VFSGPRARLCCLDLDTFFVSVERLLNPELCGKPVVVGALPGSRGVVTACSYEVRAFGVRSGMGIAEAVRRAPHAVFMRGTSGVYGAYAQRVKAILERYTPEVRTASIDEFYLDFSGCERLYRRAADADDDAAIERIVRELRERVQVEIGLPASAGIGCTRAMAKMASNVAKPAGVRMVRVGEERAFVAELPVRRFPGIGPVAAEELNQAGVHTLGELLSLPEGPRRARFRRTTERVEQALHPTSAQRIGRDRPAFREHDPEHLTVGSISNERTFGQDVRERVRVEGQLCSLAERVCWRARSRGARARTVTLRLRYSNFETLTRSRTIPPTNVEAKVYACVLELLAEVLDPARGVRLLGVGLSNLVGEDTQLALPLGKEPPPQVGRAIDDVRARFGFEAIRLGASALRK